MRARANKHPLKFCEHFEQKPNFVSTSKFQGTIHDGSVGVSNGYLSSYFIVVQVKRGPCIVFVFQYVDKAPRLLLSKPDVIATSSPLPVAFSDSLFLHSTSTSGYVAQPALERDLVYDSRCTDGVDERGLSSGYKKMAKQKWVIFSIAKYKKK